MRERPGVLERIELYRALMDAGRESFDAMAPAPALEHVFRLLDVSHSLRQREGLKRALELADCLRAERVLATAEDAHLHYCQALAREKLRLLGKTGSPWKWEQPEVEAELYHLRRALSRDALGAMPRERIARILSSMASLLHHLGRFSEAMEYWDRSLQVTPSLPTVRGKRGYASAHYCRMLHDRRQVELFLRRARADLEAALHGGVSGEARALFEKRLAWLERELRGRPAGEDLELFSFHNLRHGHQGPSEEELRYRRWCLEHRLFLNPLNDLGPYPSGARDVMTVPPMVRDRGGFHHGFFNQLKQAYVSARFLYYEGISATDAHFADRDVLLFDTLDYPTYSLSVEKVKAAFSMAYSLLEKTAHFLNHYLGLGIPRERVTLRNLWYAGQSREQGLRDEFRERRNWPLRGLFWLSKELFEETPGFSDSLDPSARELREVRYHLEHNYLKLHEDFHPGMSRDTAVPPDALTDVLAFSVYRGDVEAHALRLLKMARSALLYLSLSVHQEEKARGNRPGGNLPAIILNEYEDTWKK